MAFKKQATTYPPTKTYFWRAIELGNGMAQWRYVTTDTPATVEVSGYFNDDELEALVKAGDELIVYQVASLNDERTIQEDIASGFVDLSKHYVVSSDGTGINITPDLESATVTYTTAG